MTSPESDETIRGTLSDAVNELNKLLAITTDADQQEKLRQLRKAYFNLWQAVITTDIDQGTQLYSNAITSLKDAESAATEAQADLSKVADAINQAVVAAKAVDQIVNIGIKLLA